MALELAGSLSGLEVLGSEARVLVQGSESAPAEAEAAEPDLSESLEGVPL